MTPNEKRKEILDMLVGRLRRAQEEMAVAAIDRKAQAAMKHSLEKAREIVRTTLEERRKRPHAPMLFTYLEYLEFASLDEFKKFKTEPVITNADTDAVDMDDLTRRLQE